jgi:osmotically-inducible protein OsmY
LVGGLSGGGAGNGYAQSPGERVDDKDDSARVMKALAADPTYKYAEVYVQTFKGVAQLSGFVNSRDQRIRAADIARKVDGIKKVENKISVKKSEK